MGAKTAVEVPMDTPCAVKIGSGTDGKPKIDIVGTAATQTYNKCEQECKDEFNGAKFFPHDAYMIANSKTLVLRTALFKAHEKLTDYHNYWMNAKKVAGGMKLGEDSDILKKDDTAVGWHTRYSNHEVTEATQGKYYNSSVSQRYQIAFENPTDTMRCLCEKIGD